MSAIHQCEGGCEAPEVCLLTYRLYLISLVLVAETYLFVYSCYAKQTPGSDGAQSRALYTRG